MISVKNLSVTIKGNPILDDLTFTLNKGESVGIVGPNGAGKTTLLRHLAGLSHPSAGLVTYMGKPVRLMSPKERARCMALLVQSPDVSFQFTAFEIVRMGRYPHLKPFQSESTRDLKIIEQTMQKTGVWHLKNRTLKEMSGGERQRVFLARALVQEPEVLWLDEPTTFLDIFHQHELLGILQKTQQTTGFTWVAVLHDLNLAARYCDRILILSEGRLAAYGIPQDVLRPDILEDVYGVHVTLTALDGESFPQLLFSPRDS